MNCILYNCWASEYIVQLTVLSSTSINSPFDMLHLPDNLEPLYRLYTASVCLCRTTSVCTGGAYTGSQSSQHVHQYATLVSPNKGKTTVCVFHLLTGEAITWCPVNGTEWPSASVPVQQSDLGHFYQRLDQQLTVLLHGGISTVTVIDNHLSKIASLTWP